MRRRKLQSNADDRLNFAALLIVAVKLEKAPNCFGAFVVCHLGLQKILNLIDTD